jgi:hypothetical protein
MKYVGVGIAVIIACIIAFASVKKLSPVGWGWWGETNTSSGVALHGYDPVSYFDEESPAMGSDQITLEWSGAVWQFKNAANRNRFSETPEQYAPQFGGFCAFAVSKGFTADIDPEAWHIQASKLYVFADRNVRDDWVASIAQGSLTKSNENWAKRK